MDDRRRPSPRGGRSPAAPGPWSGRGWAGGAARAEPMSTDHRTVDVGSGVVVPAGELAAGELLQRDDVLAEAAADRLEEVVGELRLLGRGRLWVMDDLL